MAACRPSLETPAASRTPFSPAVSSLTAARCTTTATTLSCPTPPPSSLFSPRVGFLSFFVLCRGHSPGKSNLTVKERLLSNIYSINGVVFPCMPGIFCLIFVFAFSSVAEPELKYYGSGSDFGQERVGFWFRLRILTIKSRFQIFFILLFYVK